MVVMGSGGSASGGGDSRKEEAVGVDAAKQMGSPGRIMGKDECGQRRELVGGGGGVERGGSFVHILKKSIHTHFPTISSFTVRTQPNRWAPREGRGGKVRGEREGIGWEEEEERGAV